MKLWCDEGKGGQEEQQVKEGNYYIYRSKIRRRREQRDEKEKLGVW